MAIDYDILIGNSTHKEIKLQKSGDIHALQKWRACETFGSYEAEKTDPNYEAPQWIEEWLWTEELLRDIAFEELSESKDLQESNLEDKKESESLEESDYLQILAKEYWLKERKLWAIKSRFENSPFTRGLKLWRSNPNWYMHPVLIEDCTGRGGCCGRKCGCCAKRRYLYKPERQSAVGHCTSLCRCCESTRKFYLDSEEVQTQKTQFLTWSDRSGRAWYSGYPRRIILASFLGLMADESTDTFNLISHSVGGSSDQKHLKWTEWTVDTSLPIEMVYFLFIVCLFIVLVIVLSCFF